MTSRLCLLTVAALLLLPHCAHPAPDATQRVDLVFVYIHGFGGAKEQPRFCVNMRRFVRKAKASCRIENYPWDSVQIGSR